MVTIDEVSSELCEFWELDGVEEYFLKYPIDYDVPIKEDNIKEKLLDNLKQLTKYEKLYLKSLERYIELRNIYKVTIAEQYDWYLYNFNKPIKPVEIKPYYLQKDPKIKNINKILTKLKLKRDFFKLCVDNYKLQSQQIHDYIKLLEMRL